MWDLPNEILVLKLSLVTPYIATFLLLARAPLYSVFYPLLCTPYSVSVHAVDVSQSENRTMVEMQSLSRCRMKDR